jgi:hypothetical protein
MSYDTPWHSQCLNDLSLRGLHTSVTPSKKIDFFSADKNGDTRRKVALFSAESINYNHSALHGPAAQIQH